MRTSTTSVLISILTALLLLATPTTAQGFFDQFFGGQQGHPGHQHQGPPQNAPSDSSRYQNDWRGIPCTDYLCPGTLACVAFAHHCPCAFPDVEDKVELGEGIAICASKGGYKVGEMARKVELARKGLL